MFNNRGSFVIRLIGVLLLIGLMIGGGVMAYRAGVAQGIAQAPEVAEALSSAAESGQAYPCPLMVMGTLSIGCARISASSRSVESSGSSCSSSCSSG